MTGFPYELEGVSDGRDGVCLIDARGKLMRRAATFCTALFYLALGLLSVLGAASMWEEIQEPNSSRLRVFPEPGNSAFDDALAYIWLGIFVFFAVFLILRAVQIVRKKFAPNA